MFAIIWIIFWGWIFDIFNDPSGAQIFWFVLIGIGGPIGAMFKR